MNIGPRCSGSRKTKPPSSAIGRTRPGAINFRDLFRRKEHSRVFRTTFDALASSGARREALLRFHKAEEQEIHAHQIRDEKTAVARVRGEIAAEHREIDRCYQIDRAELMLTQAMDNAATRAAWRSRSVERVDAWHCDNEPARDHGPTGTQTINPTPEIEKRIRSYKEIMKQRRIDRSKGHRREHDDGRER